jgi:hypothetical protein
MREWLIVKLTAIVQTLLGAWKSSAPKPKEEEEKTCPICGLEWESKEIFCFNCGYELKDENIPLNPPPERTGAITDPDGVVEKEIREKAGAEVEGVANEKGWDIAVVIIPERLRQVLNAGNPKSECLSGLSFNLYNTWRVGKGMGLKGMLYAIEPVSGERALATGRNGPNMDGRVFRGWFEGVEFPGENQGAKIIGEISYLAGKLRELNR